MVAVEAPSYRTVNRQAWEELARAGCEASQPWGARQLRNAAHWLDEPGWIPWPEVERVLCLGAGGGQQAPAFAALGCRVTSVDLSAEQLRLDAEAARRFGLKIECVEGDMLDLSLLYGSDFDLVYQAVSACYVPDVRGLYLEVSRVLRPNGWYRVEHWNPVQTQLAEEDAWSGRDYRIARPQRSDGPVAWTGQDGSAAPAPTCWHYVHPLHDLIGGLCDAGFEIVRCEESRWGDPAAEAGSPQHLAAYLPPSFTLFSRWLPRAPSVVPPPVAKRKSAAGRAAPAAERRPAAQAPSPALRRPHTSYMICTLPRSGSWLLAESLESTEVAGRPREYFNEVTEEEWFGKWGVLSYADYLPRVLDLATTANGVFGIKCHWYQFAPLPAKLGRIPGCAGLPAPELLSRLFPELRYVWLTRRDKARQAVSLYRARRTAKWWQIGDYEPFRPADAGAAPADRALEFDFAAIERLERIALEQEANWQGYFARAGIEPLVVTYEELVESFVPQIERVLRFLEVPIPEPLRIETRMRRQADALSDQWVERYVGMKRARRAVSRRESAPAPSP